MLNWVLEHPVATFFLVLAVSAMTSHFVFHLTWPRRVLSGITTALVAITYCTFFGLTAILAKIFTKELLPRPKKEDPSYWLEREQTEATLESLRRQG